MINTNIRQNYSQILTDISLAESVPENNLAIAFTLAHKVRNHSHHLFNLEYISKEVFGAIFARISYAIISVLDDIY